MAAKNFRKMAYAVALRPRTGRPQRASAGRGLDDWRSLMSEAIRGHEGHKQSLSGAMEFARKFVRGTRLNSGDLKKLESEVKNRKNDVHMQIAGVLLEHEIKLEGNKADMEDQMMGALERHSPDLLNQLRTYRAVEHGIERLRKEFQ